MNGRALVSGVGKSTFINKFRGLTPEDQDEKDAKGNDLYAKVGLTECTSFITQYEFKENPLIELFDLPGAGTEKFPIETYPDKINITQFDAFILLTASRFHENDSKIVQEIKKLGKPYFFGRTKIDDDIKNFAAEHPRETSETFRESWEQATLSIKKNCMQYLGDKMLQNVFLLSRNDYKKIKVKPKKITIEFYDNQRLKHAIIESLPILQKTALIFSIGLDSMTAIQMKVKELRSRLWRIALVSAGGGAVPIPGYSLLLDVILVQEECDFQKEQLGIDQASLTKKAELLDKIQENLIEIIAKKSSGHNRWMNNIYSSSLQSIDIIELYQQPGFKDFFSGCAKLIAIGGSEIVERVLTFIPGIGTMAAATLSGGSTYLILYTALNMNQTLAEKCLEVVREHFGVDTAQKIIKMNSIKMRKLLNRLTSRS